MRISDWSSDVCSSDLLDLEQLHVRRNVVDDQNPRGHAGDAPRLVKETLDGLQEVGDGDRLGDIGLATALADLLLVPLHREGSDGNDRDRLQIIVFLDRSEEHTSELQSLMRISYAVFCLKKKNTNKN